MKRILTLVMAGACVLAGAPAMAQPKAEKPKPDMSLTRLDCGTPQEPTVVNLRFSDTFAYGDKKIQFVYSC